MTRIFVVLFLKIVTVVQKEKPESIIHGKLYKQNIFTLWIQIFSVFAP